VIYDPFANQYAVLGQSSLNGGDLQLVLVNPGGGIAGFNTYDSGPGLTDTPAKMMIRPRTSNYTLVGTSYNGTDDDVFVVHTNNAADCSAAKHSAWQETMSAGSMPPMATISTLT
jgi:hypothetical protein